MNWLAEAIIAGITSFAATNIDDIFILLIFFAQINAQNHPNHRQLFRIRHIVAGQYLGFMMLVIVSLPGYLGGLFIPKVWIGLLGLIPIAIGVSKLVHKDRDEEQVQLVSNKISRSPLTSVFNPYTYNVAAVTFANGGDNVGIYVSLFASINLPSLIVILIVFLLLIAIWCYIAYRLTRQPHIARILSHYGHIFVPIVLIVLGVFILVESETYHLIPAFSSN